MTDCITKRDLVTKISKETGLKQFEVQAVIQRFLNGIIDALASGNKVEMRNFGIFSPVKRKSRVGRNPANPEVPIPIPGKWAADFKPGKIMKAKVAELQDPE